MRPLNRVQRFNCAARECNWEKKGDLAKGVLRKDIARVPPFAPAFYQLLILFPDERIF